MRDGKNTVVVRMDVNICCNECGLEDNGQGEMWRLARKHAEETGHCPTVMVNYDVHPQLES